MLHNICINMGDTVVDDFPIPDIVGDQECEQAIPEAPIRARLVRDEIVETFAQRQLEIQ